MHFVCIISNYIIEYWLMKVAFQLHYPYLWDFYELIYSSHEKCEKRKKKKTESNWCKLKFAICESMWWIFENLAAKTLNWFESATFQSLWHKSMFGTGLSIVTLNLVEIVFFFLFVYSFYAGCLFIFSQTPFLRQQSIFFLLRI